MVNLVEEAQEQLNEEIYLVVGGYHLFKEDDEAVRGVIARFRELGVQKVAPCHCSGDRCRELFHEEYGEDYVEIGVGIRLQVGGE
jgi:7,8-dihydropterin-6-yl-methyl-4-(beta-D-ribofuranosyl)aminobenzene 5'-phosphate synthase